MGPSVILNHKGILELHAAALSASLVAKRTGLLAGVPPLIVAGLPHATSPDEQILADLDALSTTGKLDDGTVPLISWLQNAILLAAMREEAAVFKRTLDNVRAASEARIVAFTPDRAASPQETGASEPRRAVVTPELASTDIARDWRYSIGVMIVAVTAVIGIFAAGISSESTWRVARLCVDCAQAAALGAVFFWAWFIDLPRRLLWPGDAGKHSQECVDQFVDYWKRLWLNWIIFYAFYCVLGLDPRFEQQLGVTKYVFNNALQNLQSAMLLILFWTMIRPTLHVERNAYGLRKHHIPAWIACGAFALLEWLLLHRYQSNLAAVELWPSLVTGIGAATCLGLFIGRLESRFLDVHPFELFLLYMYAGLQPLYRILRLPNIQDLMSPDRVYLIEFLLKALALALKLGLYFVVRRQLRSGRLAFYMWKVRVLHETVPREWEAFERERVTRG